ncbi:DNA polymerase eta subunit [Trichodelitschia bisporula]|uniref:DNA polymerase eta n=1 Tax=Trichodelitschia bisporula TaxID=703511 RepID=A0A6G1HQX5_9PEZI|nr:DNA polymerase eta subunit [Trichodelitschia bisporula]
MSSSQPFVASSPISAHRSKFTWKQLHQLSQSSPNCPLRTVSHCDLDAFYAQCEGVRLGIAPDQPLAVQQWQSLIAVNYPARPFGVGRHITAAEAKKLCPELICQHVATWKEGEVRWAYHEDAFKQIATHKVSLDPYRTESKKIFAVIKEQLPPSLQRVEKAGIDEFFVDLSAQVHSILLERFPELAAGPASSDITDLLPPLPTTALDWSADHLVDLDENETEEDNPDWDDVAMLIGSEIMRGVRAAVFEKLKYTCSAGIAKNKMLAKLGSGYKKPNQQTVVRNRAVQHFLNTFKFTKIRNLGGKLGDEVVAMFNTDTVKDLLEVPLEQLKKLGDDTGIWLHRLVRGDEHSEVNPRTQIKSMGSNKAFRPAINNFEQGVRWLRIFAADIFSRCVEEGVLENIRKPKTVTVHHRQGNQSKSKGCPIPQAKTLSEELLFDLAKNLLAQVAAEGKAWPCINLGLNVSGFEDGVTGNMGIDGFLVRGEAKAARLASSSGIQDASPESEPSVKKRRTTLGIQRFFAPREDSKDSEQGSKASEPESIDHSPEDAIHSAPELPPHVLPPSAQGAAHLFQPTIDSYFCRRCNKHMPKEDEIEHNDWHFASDLSNEFREEARTRPSTPAQRPAPKKALAKGRRPTGSSASGSKNNDKGQKKLAFGKS